MDTINPQAAQNMQTNGQMDEATKQKMMMAMLQKQAMNAPQVGGGAANGVAGALAQGVQGYMQGQQLNKMNGGNGGLGQYLSQYLNRGSGSGAVANTLM